MKITCFPFSALASLLSCLSAFSSSAGASEIRLKSWLEVMRCRETLAWLVDEQEEEEEAKISDAGVEGEEEETRDPAEEPRGGGRPLSVPPPPTASAPPPPPPPSTEVEKADLPEAGSPSGVSPGQEAYLAEALESVALEAEAVMEGLSTRVASRMRWSTSSW